MNINNIDFADSNILSYNVDIDNLTLFLECWNATVIEMKFLNYVSLSSTNYFRISDFQEVYESALLDKTLDEFYELRPKEHPFRIFKFIHDDLTTLEIICENISIKTKEI